MVRVITINKADQPDQQSHQAELPELPALPAPTGPLHHPAPTSVNHLESNAKSQQSRPTHLGTGNFCSSFASEC